MAREACRLVDDQEAVKSGGVFSWHT
jgi:hypothetical protein